MLSQICTRLEVDHFPGILENILTSFQMNNSLVKATKHFYSTTQQRDQEGYEFFIIWNEIKFLGLQSKNFYVLSISILIFHSETKQSWRI